jgi:hypothetical protein
MAQQVIKPIYPGSISVVGIMYLIFGICVGFWIYNVSKKRETKIKSSPIGNRQLYLQYYFISVIFRVMV